MYELRRVDEYETIYADTLNVGDLATVDDGPYALETVLRADEILVSLSNPKNVWRFFSTVQVKRIPPGTIIQLKVRA